MTRIIPILQVLQNTLNYTRMFCTRSDIKTAGIIVIGDEILKGQVTDTNSQYAASNLHNLGVRLKKISVVGDIVEEISEEVKLFSKNYNYVITTGGIGPTHDDVTFEGVSKAFDEPLHHHPELLKVCTAFYQTDDLQAPGMKLAYVPKSAVLIYGHDRTTGNTAKYPTISVRNVFILPGIPHFFKISFNIISDKVFKSDSRFYTKHIYLNVDEHQIVQALDILIKQFPLVCVGSYPSMCNGKYSVKISIESTNEKETADACKKLLEMVPAEVVGTAEDSN